MQKKNYRDCAICGTKFQTPPSSHRWCCSNKCGTMLRIKTHIKHGDSKSKLYGIWSGMKARCYSAKHPYFDYYGGRGIKVCKAWYRSYQRFKDWSITNGYADGLEIERKENNKGYKPSNCRWATRSEQMWNTRKRNAETSSSKFKGVQWNKLSQKWRAMITINGVPTHIGMFTSEVEAAVAYDREVIRIRGPFANTNFPRKEGVLS